MEGGARLLLLKVEKQIHRENMIHAIGVGCVDILVEVPDFCQNLRLPTVAEAGKSSVLIEPLPRSPVRRIQMHEHLIPRDKTCRRMKREGPVEFEKLTKPSACIAPVILPALFESGSAGKGAEKCRS